MDPALSLTSSQAQTARHNSPALSIEPSGLYVIGPCGPSGSPGLVCLPMNPGGLQVYELGTGTGTDKYINSSNLCKNMSDDEKGEYYSLNTKRWNLLEIDRKTDSRGRIHVNEINYGKEIRVFVSDIEQEPETCKSYKLLPYSIFTEVRKSRIKDQAGEPVKVQSSGDVWLGAGNKDKYVKVFVRK